MAEPLEELFSRYDRQEPQPAPAMSTGVRMKPPVQPQERNAPTIGPASDLDAALLKYGLKGDRPNPLMEMGGRGLAYAVGSFGDIAKAAHNQLFEPAESIPGDTEWMLRKLGAAGVTGQADISEQADLAANLIDPTTGVASFLTMPAHFGLMRKMMAAQNSESTAADILKLKKKVEGYNFTGAEEAMRGIEDFSELVRRNQKFNTPFAPKSEKRKALSWNDFEKSLAFELNANCPRTGAYSATICAIDNVIGKLRPNQPFLTSDELLSAAKSFHRKGLPGPCLTCYVEAHRRAKKGAFSMFFDQALPEMPRSNATIRGDIGKYVDAEGGGAVTDAAAFPVRAAYIKKHGSLPDELNFSPRGKSKENLDQYLDRADAMKTFAANPEVPSLVDEMLRYAYRDKYPARRKWLEEGMEIPTDLVANIDAYKNDPVYGPLAKEAESYAQAASLAKKRTVTNAEYKGEWLKMTPEQRATYTSPKREGDPRGPRFSGSNDFEPDQLVDWFQALTDLSVRNLPAYTYTKDLRLPKILRNTNMKINQSLAVKKTKDGEFVEDLINGAPWEQAFENRKLGDNIGAEMTTLNDEQTFWALNNPEVDVVIPGHHAGMTADQLRELGWDNYPNKDIIKAKFGDHPNFRKITNDVRSPETIRNIKPDFDFAEAEKVYNEYLEAGGNKAVQKIHPDIVEEALINVEEGKPAFSGGGVVHVEAYDPDSVDDLVNQILKEN